MKKLTILLKFVEKDNRLGILSIYIEVTFESIVL